MVRGLGTHTGHLDSVPFSLWSCLISPEEVSVGMKELLFTGCFHSCPSLCLSCFWGEVNWSCSCHTLTCLSFHLLRGTQSYHPPSQSWISPPMNFSTVRTYPLALNLKWNFIFIPYPVSQPRLHFSATLHSEICQTLLIPSVHLSTC